MGPRFEVGPDIQASRYPNYIASRGRIEVEKLQQWSRVSGTRWWEDVKHGQITDEFLQVNFLGALTKSLDVEFIVASIS